MGIETKIMEALLEQSVLAVILLIFVLKFLKLFERFFKLIENNTAAMTKMSEASKKCKGPHHGD